jgi:transposase InsO family protein
MTWIRWPQSNGFIERLQRTLLDEHFRVKGVRSWYESIKQMQADVDGGLCYNNHDRAHQGRMVEGKAIGEPS